MNRNFFFLVLAVIISHSPPAMAQYTDDQNKNANSAPSGMVMRKVNNDVTVLMPKGARMENRNATTYVEESSDQYAARNFAIVDNRLKKLEEENRVLAEEIRYLKSKLVVPEKAADKDVQKTAE